MKFVSKFKFSMLLLYLYGIIFLSSCAVRETPAPIVHVTKISDYVVIPEAIPKQVNKPISTSTSEVSTHNIKISALNSDNSVQSSEVVVSTPKKANNVVVAVNPNPGGSFETNANNSQWIMPTVGKIVQQFSNETKGINISGIFGQDIIAVNSGKVLYSGNALKGYGNLIIIKHDDTYLTAYAHNKANLVSAGDSVTRGQKIATMGNSENGQSLLHLELRKNGKPINPLTMIRP